MGERDLRMTSAVQRGRQLTILVDGQPVPAYDGETVAAALLAAGFRTVRVATRYEAPRGYFCGMGICHDCLLIVEGMPNIRSCMTPVREGLRVETQRGLGDWGFR